MYSVLMSVYNKEKPEYLRAAMNSMWNQTVRADNFVLVCDGPLTEELDTVIDEMQEMHPELHVVRLKRNGGLGNALNEGLKYCTNELVARMDSDDISREDRCERQIKVFQEHLEISLCSGIVEEFTVSTEQIDAYRVPPETQEQIIHFSKKRNPFNHPCMMYKKADVVAAGGYQDFYLLEDYFLWIRMLQKGFIGYNLQQPLLWMRAGSEMYKRRAGWRYAKSQRKLFRFMRKTGYISFASYLKSMSVRIISALMPNWIREYMFKTILRKE